MTSPQLHLITLTTDATIRQMTGALAGDDWRVDVVDTPAGLFSLLSGSTAAVILDEAALDTAYVSLIKRVRRTVPSVDAAVIGGPKSDEVRASDRLTGVDAYHERPFEPEILSGIVAHRLKLVALKAEVGIVGRSVQLEEVLESVLQIAPTDVPIVIEGESGTGKDVLARAIHVASRRRNGSLESINCGALAEGVLESELFGHEKGAFTGAVNRRPGLFERANGSTVFLDEVGEMSSSMQVRLLRVVESGEVLRVGGTSRISIDVRLIAATNRSLSEAVRAGEFRQDLYYRLRGIKLHLPPLRDRPEDVAILTEHFIRASNRKHKKSVRGIDADAIRRVQAHRWPGNIRELRNFVDTIVVLSSDHRISAALVDSQLAADDHSAYHRPGREGLLPVALNRTKDEAEREMIYASILAMHHDVREILAALRGRDEPRPWETLKEVHADELQPSPPRSLSQLERTAIQDALAQFRGNRRKAADSLGISERTLYRKIKEYGLV